MARKKKKNKYKIFVCFVIFSILLFGFIGLLLFKKYFKVEESIFEIESRSSNVVENKKKDNDEYETIGWLRVQGTNIDCPIITGKTELYKYPVELENYGWMTNKDRKNYNVMNIFGHNIFNLGPSPKKSSNNFKRFEELMNFIYHDFAQENKYIQFTINGKDYVYKIFSVSIIYASDVDMFPEGEYSKQEKKDYIKLLRDNSIYDYDVDVLEEDDLISVVTCTRFLGTDAYRDILVSGRLVRDDEKIYNNYSVDKNNNYKKIDKVLKGDDNNEEIGSA